RDFHAVPGPAAGTRAAAAEISEQTHTSMRPETRPPMTTRVHRRLAAFEAFSELSGRPQPATTAANPVAAVSMRALDAECDGAEEGMLGLAVAENGEGILGHGAVVAGALKGRLDRLVPPHECHGVLEVAVGDVSIGQGPPPEGALVVGPASERQDDR